MNIGIIFAGGVGKRCNLTECPKQFIKINDKPIIIYTLEQFENCPDIDCVVVACLVDWIDYLKKQLDKYNLKKVVSIVPGGKTSQESIYNGLIEAKKISGDTNSIVLMHDAVRPMINTKLLTDNINAVKEYGSSITCSKIWETPIGVKDGVIVNSVDREFARIAKAPQSFWLDEILECHEEARSKGKNDYVDSCTLMLDYKDNLHCIECAVDNIKVTEVEDLYLIRAVFLARDNFDNLSGGFLD